MEKWIRACLEGNCLRLVLHLMQIFTSSSSNRSCGVSNSHQPSREQEVTGKDGLTLNM